MKTNVLSRQGTVSKSSGPTHSTSYAMKGVAVRYKPSIYVPDLLQLPVTWTKPTLPSSQAFFYDYSVEHKVAEQAKQRAMSIAAEASLQRKHVLAFQEHERKQQQEQSNNSSSATTVDASPQRGAPCLPVLSGTDILTPTPVAPTCSATAGSSNTSASPACGQSNSSKSSSNLLNDCNVKNSTPAPDRSSTANDKMDPATFKSLGNLSIKEFEGDTMDPFEIASLQAINDMEELQSVLQSTPVAAGTSSILAGSSSAASTLVQAGVVSTPQLTSHCSPISSSSPSFHAAAALSAPPLPVAVVFPVTSHSVMPAFTSTITTGTNSTGVCSDGGSTIGASMLSSKSSPLLTDAAKQPLLTSGNSASADTNTIIRRNDNPPPSTSSSHQFQHQQPHQQQVPHAVVPGSSFVAHGNPAVPSQVPVTSVNPFNNTAHFRTNPFRSSIEIKLAQSGSYPFIPVSSSSSSQQQRRQSDLDVATLIDLGGTGTDDSHPIPAPRGAPKKKNNLPSHTGSTAEAEALMLTPVPRPRRKSSSSVDMPTTSSGVVLPPPVPQPSPAVVHARATSSASVPFATPSHGRFGEIGVAVLPTITPKPHSPSPSTTQPPPQHPPPMYKKHASPSSSRKVSPPPPYSSPSTNQRQHPQATPSPASQRPPQVPRKPYSLPDPDASLTMEQKIQVKTIAGMGFPLQRVGRAMLRFEDDQTKVLDFLFMVGELEEAQFNGESAETALTVCKDDLGKAKEYLQKLEAYKEFGFHEKAIHEAYTKAKADWNEALDILTRDR